jgi:hypothetical protein
VSAKIFRNIPHIVIDDQDLATRNPGVFVLPRLLQHAALIFW